MNWDQLITFSSIIGHAENSEGKRLPVWKNPSKQTLKDYKGHQQLRASLDHKTGDAYVWSGGGNVHAIIEHRSGIGDGTGNGITRLYLERPYEDPKAKHLNTTYDLKPNSLKVRPSLDNDNGVKNYQSHPWLKKMGLNSEGHISLE
jgi:hypothetical protein